MNQKPKEFAGIILLIFFAAVFVLGAVYLIPWRRFSSPESVPESQKQIPSPAAQPTSDWLIYTNDKFGFLTKFHPWSEPIEHIGNEEVGQFTYLFQVDFGTVPLKSKYGYTIEVSQKSVNDYRLELAGHITDAIDSEEEIEINGQTWIKLNYQLFLTTENVPVTTAVLKNGERSFAITASTPDIDTVLSTFELNQLNS